MTQPAATPFPLGRIPSPPDERDWKLEDIQAKAAAADPLDAANAAVQASPAVAKATKAWIAAATPRLIAASPAPPPSPPTPPASTTVVWPDGEPVLDQGQYGTCVGNGFGQFGNTDPVDDKFTETDARAIYYEATVLDGAPDNPDAPGGGQQGATVRSGAKAMKNRGRIAAYAFATTIDAIRLHLDAKGPVVVGSNWTDAMFTPDANGYVKPTGNVAGEHCYLLIADYPDEQAFGFLNSWGAGWGQGGQFKMLWTDFLTLLQSGGEAVAAVELPA